MSRRRLAFVVAAFFGLGCLVSGCGSSREAGTTAAEPSATTGSWSVVALGDSVPRGTNCACRPYPPLTADGLTTSTGKTVRATNDAVAGATSSDVLEQLASDEQLIDHVRGAKVVEIEVGANDVAYSKSCGTALDCYTSRIPSVEKNLNAIVDRTRELTSSHKALVVLLDYWSVWLGGQFAAAKGAAYVSTAEQLTDDVDAVIKSTAAASGSGYVDLRAAFKGPTYAFDETHYLSSDGDHPNAAGHQQIAAATEAVVEKALHL